LCRVEVQQIENNHDLLLLKEVAENNIILQEELTKEVVQRGHTFEDLRADEDAELHAGNVNYYGVASQGHTYTGATARGRSKMHLGNVNYNPR
jgi:hypothetical protein